MAIINIYLNVEILACVRVETAEGICSHILIDDKYLPILKESGLADFIEGDIDDKGKVKEIPEKWLKNGQPLHEYFGLSVSTAKVNNSKDEIKVEPIEELKK